MSAMPYFDDFDLSTVDILLISQYVASFPFSAKALPKSMLKRPPFSDGEVALAKPSPNPSNKASQTRERRVHLSGGSAAVIVAQSMRTTSTLTTIILSWRDSPVAFTLPPSDVTLPCRSRLD